MSFQIQALDPAEFSDLFALPESDLQAHRARRVTVETCPGSPCRVSLEDIPVGEEALLIHYEHQPADTPFRAGHAIYIRKDADQVRPAVGDVPPLFRHRIISVRAFDSTDFMIDAEVTEGTKLEEVLERMFANEKVDYIHLHYASAGCFAATVTRAGLPS